MNLDVDKFADIAKGLKVEKTPAVFMLYKGEVLDSYMGKPANEEVFEKFISKGMEVSQLATDEKAMQKLVDQCEEALKKKDYPTAEKLLLQAYEVEQWHEKFGS